MKREGRKEGKECSKREMGEQIVITIPHMSVWFHTNAYFYSLSKSKQPSVARVCTAYACASNTKSRV